MPINVPANLYIVYNIANLHISHAILYLFGRGSLPAILCRRQHSIQYCKFVSYISVNVAVNCTTVAYVCSSALYEVLILEFLCRK